MAYPLPLEPALGLENQAWLWSAVLLGLGSRPHRALAADHPRDGGSAAAAALARSAPRCVSPGRLAGGAHPGAGGMCRVALLLAVTRYITTDIASVPLLWILPLALYLATFIHAFARRQLVSHALLTRVLPLLLICIAVAYPFGHKILAFGLAHLLVFVLAALWCHGAPRPPASARQPT